MTAKIAINGPLPDADRKCDIWTADIRVQEQENSHWKEQSWLTDRGLDDLLKVVPEIIQNLCQPKP